MTVITLRERELNGKIHKKTIFFIRPLLIQFSSQVFKILDFQEAVSLATVSFLMQNAQ